MSDDTDIRNMIDNLFSLLEWVKIYLACGLNPLEEKMRWKLFLLAHNVIIFFLLEVIAD